MNNQSQQFEFATYQKELFSLRKAFKGTPQQLGGPRALSGFAFQIQSALLALLNAWVANPEKQREAPNLTPILFEVLSDYTEIASKAIVCVQVKRTMRPHTISRALNEFWLIFNIAKNDAPQIIERLEFRLVYRFKDVKNAEKIISNWVPSDAYGSTDIKRFKDHIQIRNEPDPMSELLALTANHFSSSDPLGNIKEWQGSIINAAENGGDFDQAIWKIWSDLRGLENSRYKVSSTYYLWSRDDQAPLNIEVGPVLVGGRPTPKELREGYFAVRPKLFEDLAGQAEVWIERLHYDIETGRKLQLFWITGRSGTGKSVALLHVLAKLHTNQNNRTIIWLGNNVLALADCFRWAKPLLQNGQQVLIAIDDPFLANQETELERVLSRARHELNAIRNFQQDFSYPLIVCCGPVEQLRAFQRQFGDISSTVSAEIKKEGPEDREILWDWYQRRTGVEKSQPYNAVQDVLLVQLFFEWKKGVPIGDFAASFRNRIRQLSKMPSKSLEHFMDMLFAVNRLYVNLPKELVDNAIQDPFVEEAIRQLHAEESHLTFVEEAFNSGLRITHPHLANAIYESASWYPSEAHTEVFRRSHLETAVLQSVNACAHPSDRTRVLWAIARLSNETTEDYVRNRLSQSLIETLLESVSGKLAAEFDPLPTYLLPVLVELLACFPATKFAFSPIELAASVIEQQKIDETGFRLLCHKVLQHSASFVSGESKRLLQAIRTLLQDQIDWKEWQHVALDYKKTTRDNNIDQLISKWINKNLDKKDAQYFIQDILYYGLTEELLDSCLNWIDHTFSTDTTSGPVLLSLLANYETNNKIERLTVQWLENADWNAVDWSYVWERLLKVSQLDPSNLTRVVRLGRAWLTGNQLAASHPSWPGIVQRLIIRNPKDKELRATAWEFQEPLDLADPTWPFVWEALQKTTGKDWVHWNTLIELGVSWVKNNPEGEQHPALPGILAHLISATGSDLELRSKGWKWLIDTSTETSWWPDVWNALCDTTDDDWQHRKALIALGRKWFAQYKADFEAVPWPNIVSRLLRLFPTDSEIRDAAWTWLDKSGLNDGGSPFIWAALLDTTNNDWPQRKALNALGRKWFAQYKADFEAAPWPNIVSRLLRLFPTDSEIRDAAWTWLDKSGLNDGGSPFIWAALLDTTNNDWLHRKALIALGRKWFAQYKADFEAAPWPKIVSRLLRLFPTDSEMRDAAWTWLAAADEKGDEGFVLWKALYVTKVAEPKRNADLRRLGAKWIRACDVNDPHFGSNFEAVLDLGENSKNFTDIGFGWAKERIDEELPSFILPKIIAIDTRYDDFLIELTDWLETNTETTILWPNKLVIVLKALELRGEKISNKLFSKASASLSVERLGVSHNLWGNIWVALFKQRPNDITLNKIGRLWAESNQQIDAWASVWLHVTAPPNDIGVLYNPAILWLNQPKLTHNKWPEVWQHLWGYSFDCKRLGPLAIRWLKANRSWLKKKEEFQAMKDALSEVGCETDELRKL